MRVCSSGPCVKEVIARGAADKLWSTHWVIDYGLKWDAKREWWTVSDGHAYDGSRFGVGSRMPTPVGVKRLVGGGG